MRVMIFTGIYMIGNSFNKSTPPPVIVAGMHRAGTSLVTRILQQAGLFVGADLDPNTESYFFMDWNNWILEQAGCRWDQPEAWFLPDIMRDKVTEQLRATLNDRGCCRPYFGRYARTKTFALVPFAWGWKDPRNTLTLPLWLSLFPDARILVLSRHGLDVAESLRQRTLFALSRWTPTPGTPEDRKITDSSRCCTLEGAFSLWAAYMRAGELLQQMHTDQVLSVRYEDLLSAPEATTQRILSFCGLPARSLAWEPRNERLYAYRQSPALCQAAERFEPILSRYGYTDV